MRAIYSKRNPAAIQDIRILFSTLPAHEEKVLSPGNSPKGLFPQEFLPLMPGWKCAGISPSPLASPQFSMASQPVIPGFSHSGFHGVPN